MRPLSTTRSRTPWTHKVSSEGVRQAGQGSANVTCEIHKCSTSCANQLAEGSQMATHVHIYIPIAGASGQLADIYHSRMHIITEATFL